MIEINYVTVNGKILVNGFSKTIDKTVYIIIILIECIAEYWINLVKI